jgi:CBS domain-containing protein
MSGTKLSQSAPVVPQEKTELKPETYGKSQPISSATFPSIYNKKLNKLFRGRLVVLTGDSPISEALKKMARYNISSVPVIKSKKDTTILGFVDTLDMLAQLVKLTGTQGQKDPQKLKEGTQHFKNTKLEEIVDKSGRSPFHVLHGDTSLSDAVEQYLKGVHRIAITDDDGDLVGVVSQWTIANYLATVSTDEKEWISSLREPVGKLKYTKNVVTVSNKEATIDAFWKMHHQKLYSIAVVDDKGTLIGNLSTTDLKGFQLFYENFSDLLKPVGEFLNEIRRKQGRKENFVVSFTDDTPVMDLVTKMNDEIIHRVYIVDKESKPIRVYSLTDLMNQLIVDTHTTATFAKSTAISE